MKEYNEYKLRAIDTGLYFVNLVLPKEKYICLENEFLDQKVSQNDAEKINTTLDVINDYFEIYNKKLLVKYNKGDSFVTDILSNMEIPICYMNVNSNDNLGGELLRYSVDFDLNKKSEYECFGALLLECFNKICFFDKESFGNKNINNNLFSLSEEDCILALDDYFKNDSFKQVALLIEDVKKESSKVFNNIQDYNIYKKEIPDDVKGNISRTDFEKRKIYIKYFNK